MSRSLSRSLRSWDFWGVLVLVVFAGLQLIQWAFLPHFMDIYYHLVTSWGFLDAGGYSAWDFWQYAPIGRPHYYPPLVHVIFAAGLGAGIAPILLAKIAEVVMPIIFLAVLWRFCRRHAGDEYAFWVLAAASASFQFYLSLANHVPATLGLVFAFFAVDALLRGFARRAAWWLALCFYTHIGVAWFFAAAGICFYILHRESRRSIAEALRIAGLLALPMILWEGVLSVNLASVGFALNEIYTSKFKVWEYLLAAAGCYYAWRAGAFGRMLLSIACASLVLLVYPYRFFSGEGYIAAALLAGYGLLRMRAFLFAVRGKAAARAFGAGVAVMLFLVTPTVTLAPKSQFSWGKPQIAFGDSSFMGLMLSRAESLWFPQEFEAAAALVREHARPGETVLSTLDPVGLALGAMTARPTANSLFPEAAALRVFDGFSTSRVIVFTIEDPQEAVAQIVEEYGLRYVGRTKGFLVYVNDRTSMPLPAHRATLPWWAMGAAAAAIGFLLLREKHPLQGGKERV